MKFRCLRHPSKSELDSVRSSHPVLLVGSAVSDFSPTKVSVHFHRPAVDEAILQHDFY